jgi:hypothetical protein
LNHLATRLFFQSFDMTTQMALNDHEFAEPWSQGLQVYKWNRLLKLEDA